MVMIVHEILLKDFHTATGLEMYAMIFACVSLGFVLGMGLVFLLLSKEKTYKQGQVDALNGKVNYEKVKNGDGELVWVEKINQ